MRGARFIVPTPRGSRALRSVRVGAFYGHTIGDRMEALDTIKRGFDQLYADVGTQIGVLPYEGSAARLAAHPERTPWLLWWQSVAVPVFNSFTKFYGEQTPEGWKGPAAGYVAYGEKASTDWDTYVSWQKQLETLRESAGKLGIKLHSPAPVALPTTPLEDVERGLKRAGEGVIDAAGGVGKFIKYAAYGGLVLGGVFVIAKVIEAVKE